MNNRLIRFRAWHSVNKVMYAHKDISVLAKNIGDDSVWTFMQFAGITDVNGKSVYEGDIVTCEITERENYNEHYSGIPLVVKWDNECAGFYPFIKGSQWRSSVESVQVIVNIYENPELAK